MYQKQAKKLKGCMFFDDDSLFLKKHNPKSIMDQMPTKCYMLYLYVKHHDYTSLNLSLDLFQQVTHLTEFQFYAP